MNLKIGDEVLILCRMRYPESPEENYRGAVTKVGRKYATVTYEKTRRDWRGNEVRDHCTIEFDMETGNERGSTSHYGSYVRTFEQFELDQRRKAAEKILFTAGVSIDYSQRVTLEQIEALAEVASTFPALDRGRL